MIVRIVLIASAFLSLFFFPFPLTLILSFIAGFFFPLIPLIVGVVGDMMYYHPNVSVIPYGIVWGVALSILAFFARRFLRARIVSL